MLRTPPITRLAAALLCSLSGAAAHAQDAAPAMDDKPAAPPPAAPLTLKQTIELSGVEGRIDHFAMDPTGRILVVAALGNGSVEVIDLEKGAVARHLTGLKSPQGVAFVGGKLVVSCGEDATVRLFDAATFSPATTLSLGGDADNVRIEAATGKTFVGYGDGALAVLDGGAIKSHIALAGHPEAFALEAKGPRIFVNVPDAHHVAVVDRTAGKVTATWDLRPVEANFPCALDEERHRLFVGCREPARLLVLDTQHAGPAARVVANVEITGDVDDIGYDAATRRLYLACGGGAIDVLEQSDADHYRLIAHVPTAAGARTAMLAPDGKRLYLAVPHRGGQRAEVRVFSTAP